MDKSEVRRKFKDIRKNLRGSITSDFFKTNLYKKAESIFTFVSYGSEIDTYKLISNALSDGKRIAVPYVTDKAHEMIFIKINSIEELKPNKIGIPEPDFNKDNIIKSDINTLIIVPGLAFDKEFYRIGYGGGYYDKYISENKCMATVGVCFEKQLTSYVPREETDRRTDVIVTESRIIRRN